jgi:hypothetical protein
LGLRGCAAYEEHEQYKSLHDSIEAITEESGSGPDSSPLYFAAFLRIIQEVPYE